MTSRNLKAIAVLLAVFSIPRGISAAINADQNNGTYQRVKGQVTIVRGGKELKADSKSDHAIAAKEKDLIRTGEDGEVILLANGFVAELAKNSMMRYSLAAEERTPAILSVIYGSVRITARKGKGLDAALTDRVRVRTPNAIVGCREFGAKGIEFLVHVARTDDEFQDRIAGKKLNVPKVDSVGDMRLFSNLYSRIDPVTGKLLVRSEDANRSEIIGPGALVEFRGLKDIALTKLKQSVDEVVLIRRSLNL